MSQKMNMIIDSTDFKRDRGMNKADLSLIKDMGAEGLIKLHIPYFVYKECSSSSIADLTADLNGIRSKLSSMERKGISKSHFKKVKKIEKAIAELEKVVGASNKELWDNFVKEANAVLYEFDEKDSIAVFDAYFSGGSPFRSLKKRDDIPDAFIYETIKKLSFKGLLYLLTEDENLRRKSETLENVNVFESFTELYADPEFEALHQKYHQIKFEASVEEAKQKLLQNPGPFEYAIELYLAKNTFWTIEDTLLPSDNGEATIHSIDPKTIHVEELEVRFIDDKFFVPITVNGDAFVDYAIFKGDYHIYSNLPKVSEVLNDHYYLLEDEIPIEMKFTVAIPLDEVLRDAPLDIEVNSYDQIKLLWPPK